MNHTTRNKLESSIITLIQAHNILLDARINLSAAARDYEYGTHPYNEIMVYSDSALQAHAQCLVSALDVAKLLRQLDKETQEDQ